MMIIPDIFFRKLKESGVNFFTGVPDSLLKDICAYIENNASANEHIIAANEGNALSLAMGVYLGTGNIPLVYMQNSGLGNIVNPLLSLADPEVYSMPLLLMIGWRGEPGVKDEPQHKKQGRITLDLLEVMEIKYEIISPDTTEFELDVIVKNAFDYMRQNLAPFALVVKKGSFGKYVSSKKTVKAELSRENAIKTIVDELDNKSIIVSTTGVASRELFEYREEKKQSHSSDFLTVGGMGHASQIALGIALSKPQALIYCFDGDGAMLMHLGALAINANQDCKNLKHIVFNNGVHDSVGGQPTVACKIDVVNLARSLGYKHAMQANTKEQLLSAIAEMKHIEESVFLEVIVRPGIRDDLGRPTTTPAENKVELMGKLETL